RPLRLGVNHDHPHMSGCWSAEVHVDSLPWSLGYFPGMQWCLSQLVTEYDTDLAGIRQFVDVFVHPREPHFETGQRLHACPAIVVLVQKLESSSSQFGRYHHSSFPHEVAISFREALLPLDERLKIRISRFRRESCLHHALHLLENGITTGFDDQ